MDALALIGLGLLLFALGVGYIKLSDPAEVDAEEEETVEEETPEELAEEEAEIKREKAEEKKEDQAEEVDFYSHE